MTEPHPYAGAPQLPRLLLRSLRPPVSVVTGRRFGVTVHRHDRVPSTGPVILAANHLGWMDGPLLAVHSPRPVHALTKKEMFVGSLGLLLSNAGQIPVDRFGPDPRAMKTALRILHEGDVIGIFPEGARGAGELELFKRGAAYLALVSGAPVVPAILFGTREPGADSHSRPSRESPVDIFFGAPWQVPAQPWPRRSVDVGDASASLRTHMLQAIAEAKNSTGRVLPGPLPAGDSEREVARRQATT